MAGKFNIYIKLKRKMHPATLSEQSDQIIDSKYSQTPPVKLSNVTPPMTLNSLQQIAIVNDLSQPLSDCALYTPTKEKGTNEYCHLNLRELEGPRNVEFPLSKTSVSNANICANYNISPLYSSIDSLSFGGPLKYISPIDEAKIITPVPTKRENLSYVSGRKKENYKLYYHQDISEYANIEYKIEDSENIKYDSKVVRLLLSMEYWSNLFH